MNEPFPIEQARKLSKENRALAFINARVETACANNKFEVEIDLRHEIPQHPSTDVISLRGEEAAKLLNPEYRDALAMFRREGYGVQYHYDTHIDSDPYNGGWEYNYKVIINW